MPFCTPRWSDPDMCLGEEAGCTLTSVWRPCNGAQLCFSVTRPALLRYAPTSSPLRAHLFSVTRTPLLRYPPTSSPLPAHLFSVTRPPLLRYAPTSSPLRAHLFSVTRPALLRNAPSPSPLSAHLFSLPCPARLLPMPSVSPPRPAFPFGEFVAGPGVSSSPEQSNSEGTRKKT